MPKKEILNSIKKISDDEHLISLINDGNYQEAKEILLCLRGSYYDTENNDHWHTLFSHVLASLKK